MGIVALLFGFFLACFGLLIQSQLSTSVGVGSTSACSRPYVHPMRAIPKLH